MLVKLFDQARKFTALEAFCTAKNVINGTHRIRFLSWLPGPDSNQRLDG
jgi:hypothetical protein